MRKFITILFLASCCCFNPIAQAAEWVEISPNTYMDKSSYEYNSETKIARVWIKMINSEHSEMEKIIGKEVGHLVACEELDCARKQRRPISIVAYDTQSKILDSYDNPLSPWINIVPNSRFEPWYQLACDPKMTKD